MTFSASDNTLKPTKNIVSLVVLNKMGLHARPAAMIRLLNRYPHTEVWVRRDNGQINGKSIMGLLMLAASKGTKLRNLQLLAQKQELF